MTPGTEIAGEGIIWTKGNMDVKKGTDGLHVVTENTEQARTLGDYINGEVLVLLAAGEGTLTFNGELVKSEVNLSKKLQRLVSVTCVSHL